MLCEGLRTTGDGAFFITPPEFFWEINYVYYVNCNCIKTI